MELNKLMLKKRIYFKCPACGNEHNYALQVAEENNRYVCEKCGAISAPKNYLALNVLHGVLLGVVVALIAYLLFKQFMFDSPPVFAILAATPFVLIASWLLIPFYSRLFYRWQKI
jgi:predicted RNA-binding Zn-ribbon protein involved in translation (DUF1610 family)